MVQPQNPEITPTLSNILRQELETYQDVREKLVGYIADQIETLATLSVEGIKTSALEQAESSLSEAVEVLSEAGEEPADGLPYAVISRIADRLSQIVNLIELLPENLRKPIRDAIGEEVSSDADMELWLVRRLLADGSQLATGQGDELDDLIAQIHQENPR